MADIDTEEKVFQLTNFSGGLNLKASDVLIKDTEAVVRLNCHSDETGVIVKRNGRAYSNASEFVAGKGIYGLYKFYKSNGNSYPIAVCGTKFWTWAGVQIDTDTVTESKLMDFATYDISDIVIMCNGTDAPMKYDGTNITALGGSPPSTMAAVIVHNNRAFCYTPNSSYLYCTNIGNMESWDTTNLKWSVGSTTGDFLTGLGVLNGMLYLFKRNSVRYFMTDGDRTTWQMGDPITTKGCISRFTIDNAILAGRPVLIYGSSDGIYAFDGYSSISLTDKTIDPIFTSSSYTYRLNKAAVNTCVGKCHNGKYYFSYPYGSATSPNRTIVYDLVTPGWSEYDYGVRCLFELRGAGDSNQLYSGLTATGYVVQEDTGTADFSGDITMQYKTKNFTPGDSNYVNQFWRVYCKAEPTATTNLKITLNCDIDTSTYNINKQLTSSSSVWNTARWDIGLWGKDNTTILFNETLLQYLNGEYLSIEFYNKSQVGLKIPYFGIDFTQEYFKEG